MDRSVCITGFPGSGKSTLCHKLSESIGLPVISAGRIMRTLAQEGGLSITEMNYVADQRHEVDRLIDNTIVSYSKSGTFIFDSRLAWHFVEDSFSVFLEVSIDESAVRASSREASGEEMYSGIDHAMSEVFKRRVSELERYKRLYDLNLAQLSNYDLVVFTDGLTPNDVLEVVEPHVRQRLAPGVAFASPEFLLPTQGIRSLDEDHVNSIVLDRLEPVEVIRLCDRLFIWDGHHTVAAAIRGGVRIVPIAVVEVPVKGLSPVAFVESSFSPSLLYDWEDAVRATIAFNYKSFLDRVRADAA